MDRPGKTFLIFAVAALSGAAIAQSSGKPVIRALEWIAPGHEFEALSSAPTGGLQLSRVIADQDQNIAIGRALFETPTVLGGQAAKAGLSCASCHTNGRDNPHFLFPGVSGAPGTADVTHSFFSSKRGDGNFNPVVIPDLTQPGKVSRAAVDRDLEEFITALIVEEFDGDKPSETAISALAAYVRALCGDCAKIAQPVTVHTPLTRVEQALSLVAPSGKAPDDVKRLLIAGARHQLGLIHERYAERKLSKQRKALRKLSQKLNELQYPSKLKGPEYALQFDRIWSEFSKLRDDLVRQESLSLYNPDQLARALR